MYAEGGEDLDIRLDEFGERIGRERGTILEGIGEAGRNNVDSQTKCNTVLMQDLEKNLIFSPLLSDSSIFVTNFAVAC